MTASTTLETGNRASRQGIPPTSQEWKVTMKTSTTRAKNFRPAISKIVTALAVASVMGGMAITPALGDNHDRRGYHDKGWHKGEWKNDQPEYVYPPVYPYYYSAPVYAPPPVYYAPQPSPGISFFFPLDVHGR
jgi:hypothetical protein